MKKLRDIEPSLLKVLLGIYIPAIFIQTGTALTTPFNPLFSRELGADIAMIGAIAAAQGIGLVLFDLPGGWLGGRIRERSFILLSLVVQFACVLLKGFVRTPLQLFFLHLLLGMSTACWGIGRLAYLRRRIPAEIRGRSLALMGGIIRATRIITPVMGGFLIKFLGYRSIYFVQAGFILLALLSSFLMVKPGELHRNESEPARDVLKETFRKNGKNIIIAMAGITGLQLLRISRNLLFPLWADHIGVSVELIGTLSGASGLLETFMVIPAGIVFDRYGRKKAVVPCTLGLSVSLALLPLTSGISGLILITLLMSLFNGMGSGINMTISSDLAPKRAASEFLGIWRFVTDSSSVIAPSLAGALASLFSLALAPVAAGGIGAAAGLLMLFGFKETREEPDNTPPIGEAAPDWKAETPPSPDRRPG